ncbi:iron chelate uptake ABC transporter family permease subunit [Glutamicibacter uratoxydans]|uniref:iron chelate uptake ABC transporter family permease subunit n=1 Tax=Glutamicibacter uratoxydans TaxID=43667 RepID=UPI003D6DC7C1
MTKNQISLPSPLRRSGALPTKKVATRYWVTLGALILASLAFAYGFLALDNPMPPGSAGFWRIAELRGTAVITMAVVAVAQTVATVSFQTVTNNRIITPSIMGFDSLFVAVQTASVYLLGAVGVVAMQGVPQFIFQVAVMVALSVALYGWLLSGKLGNIQIMLLVGIIIGAGLGSVSAFMQRMLTPSEFDILTARLFGSVSNADASYFPIAIPLVIIASAFLIGSSKRLNVVALGRDTTMNLGINHRREVMKTLFFVSILIAVSTALIGPLTFFGFLAAMLSYQLADTYDHRYVFPMSILTGFVVLSGAYFVMKHVFYAQGVVGIIIELVGGTAFLIFVLRKGRL